MWKRHVVAVLSLMILGPGLAATAAAAQVPAQDSVTGSISYREGRSGLGFTFNPGTVTIYTFVAGNLGTFPVSCLGVSGNRATIVATFPAAPPPVPAGVVIHVEDNGSSGDAVDSTFVPTLPTSCPAPATVLRDPFTFGDVTVTDVNPFPTSKDECKNGGWRTFGTFKNQGDCVSFVATGGKNPPANP